MSKKTAASVFGKTPRKKPAEAIRVNWKLPEQSVGVEVEIENLKGTKWPEVIFPYWNQHRDGSLRSGREYTLAVPLKGDALAKAIADLFHGSSWSRSTTGSTHIHLDMMEEETTVEVVKTLTLMVYALEDAVFNYLNSGREWCGYTNKLRTAPDVVIASVLNASEEDSYRDLLVLTTGRRADEIGRYYGMNLMALHKYGSVEFRYFPTAINKEELIEWIQMMQSFKKAAMEVERVDNLLEIFNDEEGYQRFLYQYFPEWADSFIRSVPQYMANAFVKKALTIAESNKQVAETWTFNPASITANAVLSRFAPNNSEEAAAPNYNILIVPPTHSAPMADQCAENTVMVYSSELYYRHQQRDGRIRWATLNDVTFVDSVEARRIVLAALLDEALSFEALRGQGYSSSSASLAMNRVTIYRERLEDMVTPNTRDDNIPYTPPQRSWDIDPDYEELDEDDDYEEEPEIYHDAEPNSVNPFSYEVPRPAPVRVDATRGVTIQEVARQIRAGDGGRINWDMLDNYSSETNGSNS